MSIFLILELHASENWKVSLEYILQNFKNILSLANCCKFVLQLKHPSISKTNRKVSYSRHIVCVQFIDLNDKVY